MKRLRLPWRAVTAPATNGAPDAYQRTWPPPAVHGTIQIAPAGAVGAHEKRPPLPPSQQHKAGGLPSATGFGLSHEHVSSRCARWSTSLHRQCQILERVSAHMRGSVSRGSEGVEAVSWWAKSERCLSGPDPVCPAGRSKGGEAAQVAGTEHVGMAAARQGHVVLCGIRRCAAPVRAVCGRRTCWRRGASSPVAVRHGDRCSDMGSPDV
jgi:hypothetical protein